MRVVQLCKLWSTTVHKNIQILSNESGANGFVLKIVNSLWFFLLNIFLENKQPVMCIRDHVYVESDKYKEWGYHCMSNFFIKTTIAYHFSPSFTNIQLKTVMVNSFSSKVPVLHYIFLQLLLKNDLQNDGQSHILETFHLEQWVVCWSSHHLNIL